MSRTRLFDTHCHLFEHGFHGSTGVLLRGIGEELAAYERYRAEFGIERSLVVGYEEPGRYRGNNDYLLRLAATRDWLVPLLFASAQAPAPEHRGLSAYASTREEAQSVAAMLEAADAPAVVSLNARPEALAELAPVIRRLERTWFLVSHLGLPGPVDSTEEARERLSPLLGLAGLPNVTVKLSGQYAASVVGYPHPDVQSLVDLVAERFGADALTWGSDFSPCLEHVTFAESVDCVLPSGASESERDDILFGTADRLFDHYLGAPL